MKKSTPIILVALGLSFASASASERRFVYSYDAVTEAKGLLEYEQYFTFKDYDNKTRYEFKHELEYGITDNLQISLYLSNWRITDFDDGRRETEWQNAAVALIRSFSDPTKDFIGSAVYGEVVVGEDNLELEGKLLLQKNLGPLSFVYNLVIESEWEGDSLSKLDEVTGEWKNTFGVSYQVSPRFLVGVEGYHEVEIEEWQHVGDHALYFGPNASVRFGGAYVTGALLWQATDVSGEPDLQFRIIAGFHF